MLIDIFHDTVCPWCRIGKKHLFDALAKWQGEPVYIRWHPFLLDSTIPPCGCDFRSFMLNRKGLSCQALQQLFDYTRQIGEKAGVKLNFDKISLAVNSMLSHQLIDLAPKNIKNDVVEAIYKAYFEDGLNIGDIDVLANIGTAFGLERSELWNQLTDNDAALDRIIAQSTFARLNGITSVPFFIINNKVKVDGSHSVEIFLQALNSAAHTEITA